jgi:hypothetical protein
VLDYKNGECHGDAFHAHFLVSACDNSVESVQLSSMDPDFIHSIELEPRLSGIACILPD